MKLKVLIGLLVTAIIINMAYLDIGFNELLTREPQTSDPLSIDPFYSTLEGERIVQGINADNITIGQMSFDRAHGGILNLGGQGNANGKFVLSDNGGNEKITMDKDGMVINDGQITVKNSNNQSILDANGLVSTNNFSTGGIIVNGGVLTTQSTWLDIPDAVIKITLSRPAYVLFLSGGEFTFGTTQMIANTNGEIMVGFNIDGTIYPNPSNGIGHAAYIDYSSTVVGYIANHGFSSFQYLAKLPAGIHTIKLVWKLNVYTGTLTAYQSYTYLDYLILGN